MRVSPASRFCVFVLLVYALDATAKPRAGVVDPPRLVPQRGHRGEISALAASADGSRVASGGNEGTIFLWDVKQRRALTTVHAADAEVRGLAFAGLDRLVIADGEIPARESRIRLWDLQRNKVVRAYSGHPRAFSVPLAVSPDGAFIAAGGAGVTVWDAATGELWVRLEATGNGLAFLDENRLCYANGNETIVLDLRAGPGTARAIRTSSGQTFAISPDRRYLAHAQDAAVTIWDLAKGELLATRKLLDGTAEAAVFYNEHDVAVVQTRGNVYRLYGKDWSEVEGFVSVGVITGFVPIGGGILATTSRRDGTVSLWAVNDVQPQEPLGITAPEVTCFDAAPDGSLLVAGDASGQVRVWDESDGTAWIAEVRQTPSAATTSPSDGTAHVTETFNLDGYRGEPQHRVRSVRLAKETLAVVRDAGQVEVWVPRFRQRVFNQTVKDATDAIVIGDECLILSNSPSLQRFSLRDGKALPSREVPKGASRFALAADGRIAVGGYESVAVSDSGGAVHTFPLSRPGGIEGLAFVGPSSLLLWSWQGEETLDLVTGERKVVPDTSGGFQHVAVVPGGLVSGGLNGRISFQSSASSKPRLDVPAHAGPVTGLAVTANGKVIATAGADSSIRFWALPSFTPLASVDLLPGADWLASTPAGDFDGTPAAWSQATFHFESQPLRVYAPEQFFTVFFRPGILQDVAMRGTVGEISADPARDAASLRQSKIPGVRILSPPHDTVEYETGKGTEGTWNQPATGLSIKWRGPSELGSVRVTHPSVRTETINLEAEVHDGGSGVRDCRVFQNQSLVERFDGPFPVDAHTRTGTLKVSLETLPGENELNVYCFNDANVRSPIARVTVSGASALKRPRRAYIVAMGGNDYSHGLPPLTYAEADAQLAADALKTSLAGTGDYAQKDVVAVPLVADQATGDNFLAALDALAGRTPRKAGRSVPGLAELAKARLEDTVIIFFAGHRGAHGDRYTLYPVDASIGATGTGGIDDRRLESALRGINAGHVLLILDTCQSGQIIKTADDVRRGPLNTRGFAQLAYEKRVQVLAAAQSWESARETRTYKHGLLTYALMETGLRKNEADDAPRDGSIDSEEWLKYAVERVPRLDGEGRRAEPAFAEEEEKAGKRVQQPQMYLPPGSSGLIIARRTGQGSQPEPPAVDRTDR